MLPGLGFTELLVLGVIALLVVGPKDLPLLLRKLGQFTRKLQSLAAEFRQGFDELARQAELDELRREVEAMRRTAQNSVQSATQGLEAAVWPGASTLATPPPGPDETPSPPPPELPQQTPPEAPPPAPVESPAPAPSPATPTQPAGAR